MTTIPITDVLKSYSTCNVVLGNTTFTGTVALPATSSVTFNGIPLINLLGSDASSITITSLTPSDTWTITTDNTTGILLPFITPAYNPTTVASNAVKNTPTFINTTTINTSTTWTSGTGWLVQFSSGSYNGDDVSFISKDGLLWFGTTSLWFVIQYPAPVIAKSFFISTRTDAPYAGYAPTNYHLQWSDNNSFWTTHQSYTTMGEQTVLQTTPPHRYWRIFITTTQGTNACALKQFTLRVGYYPADINIVSVLPINSSSQFKIIMAGSDGENILASNIPIPLAFNIMLLKNGIVVNSGQYTIGALGASITKA